VMYGYTGEYNDATTKAMLRHKHFEILRRSLINKISSMSRGRSGMERHFNNSRCLSELHLKVSYINIKHIPSYKVNAKAT
jgi:hypothetical protein